MLELNEESKLTQSDFIDWKNHPVTKIIFKSLEEIREEINQTLTNSEVLLGKESRVQVPRLVGQREGLDILLQISFEETEDVKDGV